MGIVFINLVPRARFHHQRRRALGLRLGDHFWSLLPLRRKLLCCPSEWVSECNNRIRFLNELCRFRPHVCRSLKLPRRRSFLQSILQKCWLSCIYESSVVKHDILSNNRRSKLHAVIDCLFFDKALQKKKAQRFVPNWLQNLIIGLFPQDICSSRQLINLRQKEKHCKEVIEPDL